MLLVEAVAARLGAPHDGRRARALAAWLTGPAVWRERPRPSWVASTNPGSQRAPVFQAEVVRALARAYLARRALGLPRRSVARIRARIRRLARSRAYRWPALRRNQINWHVEILAAQAVVERRPALLARGMRRYLGRFLDGVRADGRSAGNLGPGLRFHYLPEPAAKRRPERRLRRVREHRAGRHPLLRGCPDEPGCRARRGRGSGCCAPGCAARWPATGRTAATSTGIPGWASRAGTSPRRSGWHRRRCWGSPPRPSSSPARPGAHGRAGSSTAGWPATSARPSATAASRPRSRSASASCRRPPAARSSGRRGRRPTLRSRPRPGWSGKRVRSLRRCTPTTPTSAGSPSRRPPTTRPSCP